MVDNRVADALSRRKSWAKEVLFLFYLFQHLIGLKSLKSNTRSIRS